MRASRSLAVLVTLAVLALAPAAGADPLTCEKKASSGLAACFLKAGIASELCYQGTGAPCPPSNNRLTNALNNLADAVLDNCSDQDVQDAGYPVDTAQALLDRLQEECLGELATVAARAYGGPHAATLVSADSAGQQCLERAAREGDRLVYFSYLDQRTCITLERSGIPCDLAKTLQKLDDREAAAAADIASACPDLPALVGVDPAIFAARAAAQARCAAAVAHPDPFPLEPDCGPRPDITVPARGVVTQIVLDESIFGTRCGDGSPYAFQIRTAPVGHPVENVLIGLEGGGVCLFEGFLADCTTVPADLFEAVSDPMPTEGAFDTSATNPFGNYTMVFLPYCTQDIFAGGGTTEVFPSITVERYGGVNLAATLRYVRDILWAELDVAGGEGFRPDRLHVLYGGASAGGFGVQNSYHWPLDEMRWVNTTALPDASLALNPPSNLLPLLFVLKEGPWGFRPFLAPYCQDSTCVIGSVIHTAHSARLGATPSQRILNVSHQFDSVQRGTTFFPDDVTWINAARDNYCAMQGTPFVHYWMPANESSVHTATTTDAEYYGRTAAGIPLVDWLEDAFVTNPAGTTDAVEEGNLVAAVSGVNAFTCAVAP